ncbi:MAG TPA: YidC/Oxa1 family membrane protein insertase [Candidatus Saccharimonadales bacterium]|nr:YidC/Oxa1 family membrane protein insertase [Candidatus Saccharimonadales bacterium]
MFTTIIVQPIFNLLALIYALLPGHNFGLAIILFTILIRLLMWPLVKKQIHHARALRELQPEIKKIKAEAAGDKRKEQMLTMELYKEKEINPLSSLVIVVIQAIILIGLYSGLNRIIKNPQQIISFSYPALHHLAWMQTLAHDIHQFDDSLFGFIDLHKSAVSSSGVYWPAMVLVLGSAAAQFYQGRQLMPKTADSRSLRQILREAGKGKSADQQEVNAAVGRSTMFILPVFVFIISINFAAALPLYWLTGSLVAIWQQDRILKEDVAEAEFVADKPKVTIRTITDKPKSQKASSKKKARRKRKP